MSESVVRLQYWNGKFFVCDVESAMILHHPNCHIATAIASGTVISHPQQNDHLTLPLYIPLCVVRILFKQGKASFLPEQENVAHTAILSEPMCPGDALYQALYDRGFWITDGIKYGAQWMCYRGDPLVFHATSAVLLLSSSLFLCKGKSRTDGKSKQLYKPKTVADLVAFARLCNTTRKTAVLATEDASSGKAEFHTIAWVPDM